MKTPMPTTMSRSAFLRGVGLATVAGAAGFGGAGTARADKSTVTYVYPSDSLPTIQEKLDAGGTVVFTRGTYALPPSHGFAIKRAAVVVKGEMTGRTHLTKIVGGLCPFRIYDELKVTIEDLWFDQSNLAAILIPCGDVTVRGNKLTNCNPVEVTPPGWYPGGFQLNLCYISEALPYLANRFNALGDYLGPLFPDAPGRVPPEGSRAYGFWEMFGFAPFVEKALSSVRIEGNTVEVASSSAASSFAISGFEAVSPARITVNDNSLRNVVGGGIWLPGFGVSTLWITRNTIENPPGSLWAVAVYDHFLEQGPGTVYICDNSIRTGGEGLWLADASGGVIKGNKIECVYTPSYPEAAGLDLTNCDHLTVQDNQITGSSGFGIWPWFCNHLAFIGNNLNSFRSQGLPEWGIPPAAVFLAGDSNDVYVGKGHLVLDYGTDNVITGVSKQVGQLTREQQNAISEAVRRKRLFMPFQGNR